MTRDEDLANLLPPTPPPKPDRREAAIEAAMRGYDGIDAPVPDSPRPRWQDRSWVGSNRPLIGALASLALVVSIGLPVWMKGDLAPPTVERASPRRESAMTAGDARIRQRSPEATAVADQSVAPALPADLAAEAPQTVATPPSRGEAPVSRPTAADDRATPASEAALALAPPPPPPSPPAPAAVVAAPASARAIEGDAIVVTGARATTEHADLVRSPARKSFSRSALSALNRCTVADPRRDIEACRTVVGEAVPTSARSFIIEGMSRAWRGDLDGAIAALDRAVEQAPRSAFAYYNRSLLLSQRGQARRAAGDKKQAAELDTRYQAALD